MSKYQVTALNKVVRGSKRASYNVEEIHKILDATFLCHIGYVWQEKAIVIPTAYGREGDTIYIHGSLKNRMIVNLLDIGITSDNLMIKNLMLPWLWLLRSIVLPQRSEQKEWWMKKKIMVYRFGQV